jgi:hypothetical protein
MFKTFLTVLPHRVDLCLGCGVQPWLCGVSREMILAMGFAKVCFCSYQNFFQEQNILSNTWDGGHGGN